MTRVLWAMSAIGILCIVGDNVRTIGFQAFKLGSQLVLLLKTPPASALIGLRKILNVMGRARTRTGRRASRWRSNHSDRQLFFLLQLPSLLLGYRFYSKMAMNHYSPV